MDVASAPATRANSSAERRDDSLALVPFDQPPDRPFERLISLTLSALLALLLSWRFLLFPAADAANKRWRQPPQRMKGPDEPAKKPVRNGAIGTGYCTLEDNESTMADGENNETERREGSPSSPSQDDWRPIAEYTAPSSSQRRPLLTSSNSEEPDQPTLSLNSVRLLLPTDQLPSAAEMINDDVESDLSSEQGPLPPYLDTITEEDTDDLISLSSGRSTSPRFAQYPTALCDPDDHENSLASSSTYLNQSPTNDLDTVLSPSEEQRSSPHSFQSAVSNGAEEDQTRKISEHTLGDEQSSTPCSSSSNTSLDKMASSHDNNQSCGTEHLSTDTEGSANEAEDSNRDERFSRAYRDYFQCQSAAKPKDMDIDFERVMKRFVRYGKVYSDAPSSGMEEFAKSPRRPDSLSSRSSSEPPSPATGKEIVNGFLTGSPSGTHETEPPSEDALDTDHQVSRASRAVTRDSPSCLTTADADTPGKNDHRSHSQSSKVREQIIVQERRTVSVLLSSKLTTSVKEQSSVKENKPEEISEKPEPKARTMFSQSKPDPAPRYSVNKYDASNPHHYGIATRHESPVRKRPLLLNQDQNKPPTNALKTQMAYQPEPQRIAPPSGPAWRQEPPKKAVVKPTYFSSSEHLQKLLGEPDYDKKRKSREQLFASSEHLQQLIDDPKFERKRKSKEKLFASSEHLQQLVQEPHFAMGKSKETLLDSAGQTGLPVTRYVEKKENGLPLSQENLNAWNNLPQNRQTADQKLLRWRNSINLNDEELRRLDAAAMAAKEAEPRERIYQPRRLADEEANDSFSRSSRRSSSRYKAKIEKARREFIQAPPPKVANGSASDLTKSPEEFKRKFHLSMEQIRRPPPEYRGPLLEKFNSKEWKSKIDLADLPPADLYARMPSSPYDNEYKRIVGEAERLWAAYRKRLATPNLYSKPRSYSTSYLETDVDTGDNTQVSGEVQVEETDLDLVHRSKYTPPTMTAPSPQERAASVAAYQHEHQSRSRTRETPQQREPQYRAKSVDYLMDSRAREETEPPENELKKVLGDAPAREMSEHELRFRKSVEKLLVPDWYLQSEYCPGGKYDPNDSRRSFPSHATTPVEPYYTPETPVRHLVSLADRPVTAQSNYHSMRQPATPVQQLSHEPTAHRGQVTPVTHQINSAYNSPWTGGRITDTRPQTVPRQRHQKPEEQDSVGFPRGFFDKYKDEIEELRRSRTSLHQLAEPQTPSQQTPQVLKTTSGVPMAAIRPRPFGQSEHSSSSLSAQSTSPQPKLIDQAQIESFGSHQGIVTSTPYNSGQLPRKAPPQVPEQQMQRVYQQPQAAPAPAPQQQYQRPIQPQPTAYQVSEPSPPQRVYQQPQAAPVPEPGPKYQRPVQPTVYQQQQPEPSPQRAYQQPQASPAPQPQYQQPRPVYEQQMPAYKQPEPQRPVYEQPAPPPRPTTLQTTKVTTETVSARQEITAQMQRHEGYTVSTLPPDWNEPGNRNSRVIEVADTFVGPRRTVDSSGNVAQRFGGRVTLEEVLDSILALPGAGQRKRPSAMDESTTSLHDTSLPHIEPQTPSSPEGPAVFTQNYMLMDRCVKSPDMAENLLQNEQLQVRCGYCARTQDVSEARRRYVCCKHCYTYYCSRVCRRADWLRHKDRCSFARVNTICKEVIMKVREDPEAQWQMSRVARQGYATRGRGSVNFRFRLPWLAEQYLAGAWSQLSQNPGNYLYYYTVPDLVDGRKEPSLIALCRRYDPRAKFILSVSIVADIDECPETPPPIHQPMPVYQPQTPVYASQNTTPYQSAPQTPYQSQPTTPYQSQPPSRPVSQQMQAPVYQTPSYRAPSVQSTSFEQPTPTATPTPSADGSYQPQYFRRTSSLPDYKKQTVRAKAAARAEQPDARNVLRSVLRSLENIAPGSMEELNKDQFTYDPYERPYSAGAYTSNASTPQYFRPSVPSTPATPVIFQDAPINV